MKPVKCSAPPVTGCAMVAVFLMAMTFVTPGRTATIVERGQARAVIILPERPSLVAEGAARALRDHIRQMSGAELPIRSEGQALGGVLPGLRAPWCPRLG